MERGLWMRVDNISLYIYILVSFVAARYIVRGRWTHSCVIIWTRSGAICTTTPRAKSRPSLTSRLCLTSREARSYQCWHKILNLKYYTLFWQSLRIIFHLYFFQSNTLRILIYMVKLYNQIILFLLFSLKYLIYASSLATKDFRLAPRRLCYQYTYLITPHYSKFTFFHKKLLFGPSISM